MMIPTIEPITPSRPTGKLRLYTTHYIFSDSAQCQAARKLRLSHPANKFSANTQCHQTPSIVSSSNTNTIISNTAHEPGDRIPRSAISQLMCIQREQCRQTTLLVSNVDAMGVNCQLYIPPGRGVGMMRMSWRWNALFACAREVMRG